MGGTRKRKSRNPQFFKSCQCHFQNMNLTTSLLYPIPSHGFQLAQNKIQTPNQGAKAPHIPLPLSLTLCPTTLPRWPFCHSWNTQANSPSRTLHLLCPLPQKLCPHIFTMAFSFPLFMCQLKPHLLGGVFPDYPISFSPPPSTP